MGTRGQWSIDFAKALGNTTPSASLINWISAWTAKEGTKAKYNPLATTYDLPPNTRFNSVGVRNFESRAQGIEATVRTLRGDHPGYADIIEGIVTNNPQLAADGLKGAPWGTNGTAVEALWRNADVRDQMLLSESESEGLSTEPAQGVFPRPSPPSKPVNPLGPETSVKETPSFGQGGGGGGSWGDTGTSTQNIGRRTAYVLGGSLLVVIAGILAFKAYVPTTEIVKTVASAAL